MSRRPALPAATAEEQTAREHFEVMLVRALTPDERALVCKALLVYANMLPLEPTIARDAELLRRKFEGPE